MNEKEAKPLILVAEDEMLIAMMLEDTLLSEGFRPLMVARVAKGVELASVEPVAAAILDINLSGQDSFPIADILERRHIPFMFSSGYGKAALPDIYKRVKVLQKPFAIAEVMAALILLLK